MCDKKRFIWPVLLTMALSVAGCNQELAEQDIDQQPLPPDRLYAETEAKKNITLALMVQINDQLAERGSNLFINEIQVFAIRQPQTIHRVVQQPSRWVPGDVRRLAQGGELTYLVDLKDGSTSSGLTAGQTEAAIDRAMSTWDVAVACADRVVLSKRVDAGSDPDIFDAFLGFGQFGNPFLADIVNAGWMPGAFFAASNGVADAVLGMSVTFIFVDDRRTPTDIDGDRRLDTALTEVYYNDSFGVSEATLREIPWGIDVEFPQIDVETVGLRQNGHSLGSSSFQPSPLGAVRSVYTGARQRLDPTDQASHCANYATWPRP